MTANKSVTATFHYSPWTIVSTRSVFRFGWRNGFLGWKH
jgi:hypothetical protein